MGYMGRDVEVVAIDEKNCIVVACDSCGAAGSKELDVVKVPSYIVGRFTARVALLEVMAVGARPIAVTAAAANEPVPTSADMLEGIRDELKALALTQIPVVISTEKNMPTKQTGLGIGVTGLCEKSLLRINASKPGDFLYCLGLPKVGDEVRGAEDPEIIQGNHIETLLKNDNCHDIVPVGSRGISGEAASLAAQTGCRLELFTESKPDLNKSAGPSTCLIFTCAPEHVPQPFSSAPLFKIGRLVSD